MRFASVASCRPSPLHTSHQLPPKMASVTRIAPGQKMPSKMFKLAGGGEACIAAVKPGHIAKLVVIYRGQFCPFCKVRTTGDACQAREAGPGGHGEVRARV